MKYLDEKLALLNTSLVKENLSRYSLGRLGRGGAWGPFTGTGMGCPCRVLEALWELLLQAILRALGANLDVSADFYGRFHFTLEVGGGASLLGLPDPCPGHPAMCPPPGGLAFPARTAPLGSHQTSASSLPAASVSSTWATCQDRCLAPGTGIPPPTTTSHPPPRPRLR